MDARRHICGQGVNKGQCYFKCNQDNGSMCDFYLMGDLGRLILSKLDAPNFTMNWLNQNYIESNFFIDKV